MPAAPGRLTQLPSPDWIQRSTVLILVHVPDFAFFIRICSVELLQIACLAVGFVLLVEGQTLFHGGALWVDHAGDLQGLLLASNRLVEVPRLGISGGEGINEGTEFEAGQFASPCSKHDGLRSIPE